MASLARHSLLLMLALMSLTSVALRCATAHDQQAQHTTGAQPDGTAEKDEPSTTPYAPHTPEPHTNFLQGWYTRLNTEHDTSLAVVLGQYIQSDLEPRPTEHPPVLCMVLVQPPSPSGDSSSPPAAQQPLHAYTRWFGAATIITDADQATATTSTQRPVSSSDVMDGSATTVPPFQVLTSGPAINGYNVVGKGAKLQTGHLEPTLTAQTPSAQTDNEGCFCKMVVNASHVLLQAHFPGSLSLNVVSSGPRADATPWSPNSASPEGWVGDLGKLVAVHYATLSLATPANFHLALGPHVGPEPSASSDDERDSGGDEAHQQGSAWRAEAVGDGMDLHGAGMMHLESQYGRDFPPRWLWAQGHEFTPGGVRSFVLAGGDLPHALPGPPIHQFLFSFRDAGSGISVAADPWDPPLPVVGIHEEVAACDGRLHLELDTLTHIIQVTMSAPPGSFSPVACPSQVGFIESSVETYQAHATITIYQRGLVPRTLLRARHLLSRAQRLLGLRQPVAGHTQDQPDRPQGPQRRDRAGAEAGQQGSTPPSGMFGSVLRVLGLTLDRRDLLVNATFTGAALEYGGKYRCGMGSSDTSSSSSSSSSSDDTSSDTASA